MLLASFSAVALAENIVFPADSGVVNVKNAPYNARGDGVTDDTLAIQKALDDTAGGNRIVYFPEGVYLISDTLRWAAAKLPDGSVNEGASWKNQIFEGQSRERSVLRLSPKAKGFDDPNEPKAMIWTGPKPAQRFRNAVRNLTLDAGDFAGAIGLQFNASNQGTVREVTIRGKGTLGLDMAYTSEIGPLLIKDVTIEGFAVSMHTGGSEVNSMTLEDVAFRDPATVGLLNDGQCVSIHQLRTRGQVTMIHNRHEAGLIVLVDAQLEGHGRAAAEPALANEQGLFYGRDVRTRGYRRALVSRGPNGGGVAGPAFGEFVSHPPLTVTPALGRSLRLPIVDAPEVPWDELDRWVSPTHFGAVSNDGRDDSDAIQKAVDSGKTTLYFPAGLYHLDKTVMLRGNIRRVIGCEAILEAMNGLRNRDEAVFRIEDGTSPVLVVERLQGNPWGGGRFFWFEQASRRDLVIRHSTFYVAHSYRNTVTGGRVFLEDVSNQTPESGFWRFNGQTVYARQWNVENVGTKIVNDGGTLWVLGYKTERSGTLIETRNGSTELLGGLCYSLHYEKNEPMFANTDSDVSIAIGESVYDWGKPFGVLVAEKARGKTYELTKGQAPARVMGSALPLYRSSNRQVPAASGTLPAPTGLKAVALSPSEIALSWTAADSSAVDYVVSRQGQIVGIVADPAWVDRGLSESSTQTYQVVARDAHGRTSSPASVEGTTAKDTAPAQLLHARALRHPDRIELHMNKPIDPASIQPALFKVNGFNVTAARASGDSSVVELLLEGVWPSAQVTGSMAAGLTDRSLSRNVSPAATFSASPPPPDKPILERNYDRERIGSVPEGVMDNSDWNGGKVEPAVVAARDGQALRLKVSRFGQIVLAWVPLEAGSMYVVTSDLEGGAARQTVVLQVRQWDFPHTVYGQGDFVLNGSGRQTLSFTFKARESSPSVPLFFIVHGEGTFLLDHLRFARVME